MFVLLSAFNDALFVSTAFMTVDELAVIEIVPWRAKSEVEWTRKGRTLFTAEHNTDLYRHTIK